LNNTLQCRRLINDLLTSTNPDGSLKYPRGLFTSEIKTELDSSWGWGDIGAALNCAPLPLSATEKAAGKMPIVIMGIYAVQSNGYAAKRWTVVTKANRYATQSMQENLKGAETQIRKLVNNRMRPAIVALLHANGDTDDLPHAMSFLDQALLNIKNARQAGDEKAKLIKAEEDASQAKMETTTVKADLKAAEAKLAEVQAELEALRAATPEDA
jgi:hypothetical protein